MSRSQSSLPSLPSQPMEVVENGEIEQNPLPPTDRGKAAWLVLAGCCVIQIPVWGFSLAFGVLQEYYATHHAGLEGDRSSIAIIGTTTTGIIYLLSPISFALLSRWPRLRPYCGPFGLLVTAGSFLLSSFATTVWQLIATQGVLAALGSGLMYAPTTLYLDEWFIRRKGTAIGLMGAAKSAAGAVLPFLTQRSLEHFGPRPTIWAWTVGIVILTAPLLFFLKPRIPLARSARVRKLDTAFFRSKTFWMLQTGNILQSLGYFLPSAYLSTYAVSELGLSSTVGTALIALLNTTSIFGSAIIGTLNDHSAVTSVTLVSTTGSAISVFFFWGLSSQISLLVLFSIIYGFFAGGFSSTWPGILSEIKKEVPSLDTGFVFGLLAGGRGIGNVISGPLSVALMTKKGWLQDGHDWGYSSEFGPMILFTGATAVLGGLGWLKRYL